MDSLITGAALALARGDPLGALNRVALRQDAPALALRGIAMAQLGEFERARSLLQSAVRAFGVKEALARARCVLALAEIALATRDLALPARALGAARTTLERQGDQTNAAHARHLEARYLLLLGRLDEADQMLDRLDPALLPPAARAAHELVVAGIAIRRLDITMARAALVQAQHSAGAARILALAAEVERATQLLDAPAARLVGANGDRLLRLDEVAALQASDALVIDGCRHVARRGNIVIPLATRPVLFALLQALGKAWPADVARDQLLARAFGAQHADESHRARLRVELGRLRAHLLPLAGIGATRRGFALLPLATREVAVLARPFEERHAAVLALLADGEAWSSSALALALGRSQRSVQRALDELAVSGQAQWFGRGRARRWLAPAGLPGITTTLLLPVTPSSG